MTTSPADLVQRLVDRSWKALVGVGIASAALGVIALVWPGRTTLVVAVLFGIYLLVSGAGQLVIALASSGAPGGVRVLTAISGALSLALGLVCFRDELQSVVLLAIWVGVGWIMAGVSSLFDLDVPGSPTWLRVLQSVLLVVGGAILVASPIESLGTLVWVTGAMLVALGIVQVVHGIQLRGLSKAAS